eukprot:6192298-Pleurochrysis_carterae.AAC.2
MSPYAKTPVIYAYHHRLSRFGKRNTHVTRHSKKLQGPYRPVGLLFLDPAFSGGRFEKSISTYADGVREGIWYTLGRRYT